MKTNSEKDFVSRLRSEQIIKISDIKNSDEFNMRWIKIMGKNPSFKQRELSKEVTGFTILSPSYKKSHTYKRQYYEYRGRRSRSVGREIREEKTSHYFKRGIGFTDTKIKHYRNVKTGRFTYNPANIKYVKVKRSNRIYNVIVDKKTNRYIKWLKT